MSVKNILMVIAFVSLLGALVVDVKIGYDECRSNGWSYSACTEGVFEANEYAKIK